MFNGIRLINLWLDIATKNGPCVSKMLEFFISLIEITENLKSLEKTLHNSDFDGRYKKSMHSVIKYWDLNQLLGFETHRKATFRLM